MDSYTVVWSESTIARLTEIWLDNPFIRREVTNASDEIDHELRFMPQSVGIETDSISRFMVRLPLAVLYLIREDDRQVRVLYVKLWDE